jgi:hypothetical protein
MIKMQWYLDRFRVRKQSFQKAYPKPFRYSAAPLEIKQQRITYYPCIIQTYPWGITNK